MTWQAGVFYFGFAFEILHISFRTFSVLLYKLQNTFILPDIPWQKYICNDLLIPHFTYSAKYSIDRTHFFYDPSIPYFTYFSKYFVATEFISAILH